MRAIIIIFCFLAFGGLYSSLYNRNAVNEAVIERLRVDSADMRKEIADCDSSTQQLMGDLWKLQSGK